MKIYLGDTEVTSLKSGEYTLKVYFGEELLQEAQGGGDTPTLPLFIGTDNRSLHITTEYPITTHTYDAEWNSSESITYLSEDIVIEDLTKDAWVDGKYSYYPSFTASRTDIGTQVIEQDCVIGGETYTSYWQYLTSNKMKRVWYERAVNNSFEYAGGTPQVSITGTLASTAANAVLPMKITSLNPGSTYKLSSIQANGTGQADEAGWIICTDLNDIDNTTLVKVSATPCIWGQTYAELQADNKQYKTPVTISSETPTFKYQGGDIFIIGFGKQIRGRYYSSSSGWSFGWEFKLLFSEIPDPVERTLTIRKTVYEADGMQDMMINASGNLTTSTTSGIRVYANGEAALLGNPSVVTKYYKTEPWTQPVITSSEENAYGPNSFGITYINTLYDYYSWHLLNGNTTTAWREEDSGYYSMYISLGDLVKLESITYVGIRTSSSSNSKSMTINVAGSKDGVVWDSLASSLSVTPKSTAANHTHTLYTDSKNKFCRFIRITTSTSSISGYFYMNEILFNNGVRIVGEGTADDYDVSEEVPVFEVISGKAE